MPSVQPTCGESGYVRGSRGWRSHPPTAGSGGSVTEGAPGPDETALPPVATYRVAEPDVPPPSGRCLWIRRARRAHMLVHRRAQVLGQVVHLPSFVILPRPDGLLVQRNFSECDLI
jgi:hypothetical protein